MARAVRKERPVRAVKKGHYEPTLFEGVWYYTALQFADIVGRTPSRIYQLLTKGNGLRCLECKRIGGKPFIPVSEVDNFPFNVRKFLKEQTQEQRKNDEF